MKQCPTDKMLVDFFTKPLQGNKFHYFREFIMGWRPISELWASDEPAGSKERVEFDTKNEVESKSNHSCLEVVKGVSKASPITNQASPITKEVKFYDCKKIKTE